MGRLIVDQSLECNLMEKNLFKIFLSLCEKRNLADKIPGIEEKKGRDFLLGQLIGNQGTNGPAGIKAVAEEMDYEPHRVGDVVLITCVGAAYPYVRVHAVLEGMQARFSDVPVLVMYPGEYDGRELRLFGRFEPKGYYRAFNIL